MKIEVYSPTIRRKEMDAVLTAMVNEKIGPGEKNKILIQTAKEHLQFDYSIALRSPAVALHYALKALKFSPGMAVLISALSPRYYLNIIEDLQLTPVFCDVTYDFPCMNRRTVENAINEIQGGIQICAVILHHTLGYLPDTASILELGFPVIEDISQSYGSWLKFKNDSAGDNIDEFNKVDENKNEIDENKDNDALNLQDKIKGVFCILGLEERDMLTSGGGALLFAMNKRDGSVLRNFSSLPDEYCLPDINAALAIVQFKEFRRNIEKRRIIAGMYKHASLKTRHKNFISLNEDEYNNYSFSLVLDTGLKEVASYARKKEIIIENAFDNAVISLGVCRNCPVSNSLALRTILFPLYPRLRSTEAERVSRLIMTLP